MTKTAMKVWMVAATVQEQEELAAAVGTTRGNLYQYAGGHRSAGAERAGAIERASAAMHKASKGRLPRLYRTDLAKACGECPFAKKCIGVVSEFPINTS